MELLLGFLVLFPLFMMTVVIHEVSHGVVANWLGDPTARDAGRLTLNPLKHIDPFGTLLLPLMLRLANSPVVFGWAKPVPVDYRNLKHPKRDMFWIGAAGPAANFLMAAAAALLLRAGGALLPSPAEALLQALAWLNLSLGMFNLLPVPPLDGSRVLAGLLPVRWAAGVLRLERWGILILVGLLYFGVVDRVIWPAVVWLAKGLGL
jgi:Zn-dependent protease